MSMRVDSPFRVEDFFDTGSRDTIRIVYFQDPNSGDWVSTHVESMQFGRNSGVGNQFYRSINGVTPTASFGPGICHDFKVMSLVATQDGSITTPSQQVLRLYNNGNQLGSDIPWEVDDLFVSLNLNGDPGNLSIEIADDGFLPTPPTTPAIHIEIRWRL